MNGPLRQYFPKGTNLTQHTPEKLKLVAARLNSRPRKIPNWATPAPLLITQNRTAQLRRSLESALLEWG